jgi:hypothetical protein
LTKKNTKIRSAAKIWFNKEQSIVDQIENLNKMEKIIEEQALCGHRLMATSNDLQQVLDGHIKYPEHSIPPIGTTCINIALNKGTKSNLRYRKYVYLPTLKCT